MAPKLKVEIIFQFHRLAASKTNQQQTQEYQNNCPPIVRLQKDEHKKQTQQNKLCKTLCVFVLRFKVFLVIPNMFFLEPDIRLPHGHHPGDHLLQTRRPKTPGDQDILGLTRTP